MWVTRSTGRVREGLSIEICSPCPLLSRTQGDLTALLTEVKPLLDPLEVPVRGGISDGEETRRRAGALVVPEGPHHWGPFHSLKNALQPLYEADRHAKTHLKKQRRGVRPIERALEEHRTPENDAIATP